MTIMKTSVTDTNLLKTSFIMSTILYCFENDCNDEDIAILIYDILSLQTIEDVLDEINKIQKTEKQFERILKRNKIIIKDEE